MLVHSQLCIANYGSTYIQMSYIKLKAAVLCLSWDQSNSFEAKKLKLCMEVYFCTGIGIGYVVPPKKQQNLPLKHPEQ